MAGYPASDVEWLLRRLSDADRQQLLCTLCQIHIELASNCQQHGQEVSALLTEHCPLYIDGVATCLIEIRHDGGDGMGKIAAATR